MPPKPPHLIQHPDDDEDLQRVLSWLRTKPGIKRLLTGAVVDAIDYILDGWHTGRFDLDDTEVDSDERASVGTKVQYRIIHALGLEKTKPLDTVIDSVPVDIKNTVRDNWMIPKEGQCEICLLVQIDNSHDKFAVWLMRTHETMLRPGKNQDSKRSIIAAARDKFRVPVFDEWLPLPRNPLRDLTPEQRAVVFNASGLRWRSIALFSFLPRVIIPRRAIETLGANMDDPMRRVREGKGELRSRHGLELLGGKYEGPLAAQLGYTLGPKDWVAVPLTDLPTPAGATAVPEPGQGSPAPLTPGHLQSPPPSTPS